MRSPSLHTAVLIAFLANMAGPLPMAQAQEFRLPAPGVMVHLSPPLDPPILKGIKVHPDDPFRIDFILDKGEGQSNTDQLKSGSGKLIKYFLASLTIPEKDLWVNLSPYEKDRIIPESFGLTEMGRDLLAEDYMLKQITASLIYPEDEIGRKFWKRVYEKAALKYGTTNIPVNTFNKVWIVPDKAVVYENAKAGTAYVVESRLKVMLEEDYLALKKNSAVVDVNALGSQVIREIVIPELNNEVNNDRNFSQLRQVYNSLILAAWYKKKINDSILAQVYADKKKVAGVGYGNTLNVASIYQRYLQAFKKGVYNYIKEEQDPLTRQVTPRKYFSGGMSLIISPHLSYTTDIPDDKAMISPRRLWDLAVNLLRPGQVIPVPEQMDPVFLKQVDALKLDMQKFNEFLPQLETAVGQYQRQVEKNAALDLDPHLTFDPNKGFGMVLAQLADANGHMQQGNIPRAMQEWGRVFGIYQAVQAGFDPFLRQYTDKLTRNFMYRFTLELNNYFGQYLKHYGLKGLRGMEGGAGAGRLVIVHGSEQEVLDQLRVLQPNEIVVMDQDYESLATAATNAGGFIFGREGAGHIMTRARALKVPVMSLPNAVEYLKQFDGTEWVEMDNRDRGGELRFLDPEERNIAPALQRSPDVVPPVEMDLKGEAIAGSDELYQSQPSIVFGSLSDMAKKMGYKAANLIYNRREAGVPMPRTVILMNRFFEDLLNKNNIRKELKARFKMIDKSEPQTVRQNLEAMQALIRDMEVPPELKQEIWEKLEFIKVPYLILRLSTGAEDLEDFPGVGAGVYGSTEGIPWAVKNGETYEIPQANKDNLIARMLEIYATYWSFKAYADREHFSIDHWDVGNAMIIQEYLSEAKYSVLVHTAEPSTRNSNIMKIEIVPGAGKSITDTDRLLQGSALTLFYDKKSRKLITEDDPRTQYHPIGLNKKYMVSLETGADEPIDKNEYPELWTGEGQSALADKIVSIASKIENNRERAQDIEGVIQDADFIPVQSRAQEDIAPYQGGYREQQEYQRWGKALSAWLDTYGRQDIANLDFYKGEAYEAPSLRDLLPIRNVRPSSFRTSLLRSLGLYDKTGSVEHTTRLYNFLASTDEFNDVREGIMRRTLFYVALEHSAFVEYFFGLAEKPDLLLKMVHYAITPLSADTINRGEFNRDWFMQVNAFLLVRALARSRDLQEKLPFIIKNLSAQDLVSLINQIYLSSKSGELNKGEVKSLKNQFKDILESPDLRRSDLAGLLPDAAKDLAMKANSDSAMISGTYVRKPEREITERQALRDAAVEIQLSLNDLYAALSVAASREQALEIRAGIADLEERIGITLDPTVSYQGYSEMLKAKRRERDILYADFERTYLDKGLQGAAKARLFAELNLRAIHINQEIMDLQIFIADLLLNGRSQLKQASMMQKAALWTLEGALNSTAMLREELNYRISRLQAQSRVRRIETKDWLGNIVRTFRLGALDIKVLEGPASENLPNVTIRQQRWINIPTQLRDILTDARQGRTIDALNKLQRLSPLFDVRYLSFYKRFGEIRSEIKALQGALSGLREGEKPDQDTMAGLKARIDNLIELTSARPKRRVWEDVNVKDIGAAFRSYIYRLSGYVQDIGKISYNKVLLDSYIERLNEAQAKGKLALRQQEMMRIGLEEILAWVDQGFVDQKQFSRADIVAAIEGIGTSNWAGAARALQRVQGQLQERLDDIDRIVMYSREHAAAVFSEYRDTDIKLRMDEIGRVLDGQNIEDALNKLNEVQELYQLDDQLEPGLQRAGQGIDYLIKVLTAPEGADTARVKGYLTVIKDDIDHNPYFRIIVSNEAGEKKFVYVRPNTSIEGLLNIGRRDINKIKVTVGRTVIPRTGFADYKLKDLSRVTLADKAMLAPGGIDLTPVNMNLQTQNAGGTIKFHLTPTMFQELQNVTGFVPVIINIQPIASLKSWLLT